MTQQQIDFASAARYSVPPASATCAPACRDMPGVGVDEHPVFALLDAATRERLQTSGESRTLDVGETLTDDGCVAFVQEGLLARVAVGVDVCVSVAGAGAVLGLESGFGLPARGGAVALSPSQVYATPASELIEALGRSRVLELCLIQSLARLDAMETETACNAAHLVPQRLAKWLVRLHHKNRGLDIPITQADLARLMGVQRTSVNAAARQLQLAGAARFARGLIIIKDLESLKRAACSCAV